MFNFFKKKDSPNFKLTDGENYAYIICDHVANKERPIPYACHDGDDGSWQFLCGQDDHNESNAKVISLKNVTEIDETINDLYEMPLGVGAEREKPGAKWIPFKIS